MRRLNHWKAAGMRLRALMLALALLVCLPCAAARAESDGMLRVKLTRLGSPSEILLSADCDYYLADDPSLRLPAGTEISIAAADGALTLTVQGRAVGLGGSAQLMRSESGNRGVSFTSPALSGRFCGDLSFSASGDAVTTVLRIYVEDYLYGVVGCEMAPSSGLEALKAQAVVARNYALRQKAARTGSGYDLSDSGDALSFRGYNAAPEYADAIRAVDETRGQVLYYGDSPATCYFCDSNGGQTESAQHAFGASLPYSVVMDDPYDLEGAGPKKTALLRKDATELRIELVDALIAGMAGELERLGLSDDPADVQINGIDGAWAEDARYESPSRLCATLALLLDITGRTPAGEVRQEQVTVAVPTYGGIERWYDLGINESDNETVWVSETDRGYEITFRRSGSGVGMSQRGAQVMARKGLGCADILSYYYPGTALRQVSLEDATRDSAAPEDAAAPEADPIASARLSQKSRLYDRADDGGRALTTLPAGATVQVYAVQGDWASVGSGGLYGFIRAEGLTAFELAGVTAAQVKDDTVARVSRAVDVLQLPVDTAKALDALSGDTAVRLNAYTDAWAMITTESGVQGFIPRDALTLAGEGESDGDGIVTAPEDMYGLLTGDAGLYVNADDSVAPRLTLARDDRVRILAYNDAWAYVRTDGGETGYMKLSGLSAVRQPEPAAEGGIDGGAVTVLKDKPYRWVAADALSLFESYSTESRVLATLQRGDRVRLGAYNEKWACVRVDGVTGFALLSGLTDADPDAPEAEQVEGGSITVIKGTQYATVVLDGAPMYPTWDAASEPLTLLRQDDTVQLGAYNGVWACVRVDGVTGFMRVEALELPADIAPKAGTDVHYTEAEAVTAARLSLYQRADLTGAVVAELDAGQPVHVYAYDSLSAYVECDGQRGFAPVKFLKKPD